jgi:hypothetical protein
VPRSGVKASQGEGPRVTFVEAEEHFINSTL